uniref:Nucleoside triphosphate pyrophosphohydrolase n=1 Tax=candidate division WOR-3 bacterium TaxID=2052148 RepID=A0A7V3PTE3_UNCW3
MIKELIKIVKTLRRRCPWDRKQTLSSTRPLLLNEVYELDDALRRRDKRAIIEELGDYLFMGFFLAAIMEEKNKVKLQDILNGVIKKLKDRHPHIYGNVKVKDEFDVLRNWEKIKNKDAGRSLLSGIPVALPALQQAQLIQERCRRVGFDWEDASAVLLKVEEELKELKAELDDQRLKKWGAGEKIKEELGDLLFALVNLCRHLNVDAEGALKDANLKFRNRFQRVEQELKKMGKTFTEATLAEMEAVWQQVKNKK